MATDTISIIIVTFNVSKFVTFCLDSLNRSEFSGKLEIIVVDNNSSDNTVNLIKRDFPKVEIIRNDSNLGFSKACNQGASQSHGDYLLFLNPDCIVSELALQNLLDCFNNDKVGCIGPLFINGQGEILSESARELPTTKNAVTKLFRLPLEKTFPYYRKVQTNKPLIAPILCGACMLMRKEIFVQIQGFDERFFMYGEDIDLSFRLIQLGYSNYCVPEARVIHFKGESTDRGIMKNNSNFYNAISLYAEKHSESFNSSFQKFGLGIISNVFPILRYVKEYIAGALPLLVDFFLIITTFFAIQFSWSFFKYETVFYFGTFKYLYLYIGYAMIWLVTLIYQGAYFSNERIVSVYKGALIGGVINLILFAMLPFEWRFSRGILLLSSIIIPVLISLKYILNRRFYNLEHLFVTVDKDTLPESEPINFKKNKVVNIDQVEVKDKSCNYIFDFNNLKIEKMIELMMFSGDASKFDFYDRQRTIVFSSEGERLRGDRIQIEAFMNLSQKKYLLQKRTLDIVIAILLIIPVLLIKIPMLTIDLSKIILLMKGRLTSVGYGDYDVLDDRLPSIPQSVLLCYSKKRRGESKKQSCMDYAFNYSIFEDIFIIVAQFPSFIKAFI